MRRSAPHYWSSTGLARSTRRKRRLLDRASGGKPILLTKRLFGKVNLPLRRTAKAVRFFFLRPLRRRAAALRRVGELGSRYHSETRYQGNMVTCGQRQLGPKHSKLFQPQVRIEVEVIEAEHREHSWVGSNVE